MNEKGRKSDLSETKSTFETVHDGNNQRFETTLEGTGDLVVFWSLEPLISRSDSPTLGRGCSFLLNEGVLRFQLAYINRMKGENTAVLPPL